VQSRTQQAVPDTTLVARVARGDVGAFTELYERYARVILAMAAHTVGRSDAEEVVQDVFLRLWNRAGQFDPARGSFAAWFMTIARHRVVDELERRRRGPTGGEAVDELLSADTRLEPVDDPSPTDRLFVLDAVRALPAEQRRVLVLAYFGGMSQAAIAAHLDLPLGTVKKRIRLGLQKLRASLEAVPAVENTRRPTASRYAG
jgi:RNA polymerase sigma-70 factor (ECF subfamily)